MRALSCSEAFGLQRGDLLENNTVPFPRSKIKLIEEAFCLQRAEFTQTPTSFERQRTFNSIHKVLLSVFPCRYTHIMKPFPCVTQDSVVRNPTYSQCKRGNEVKATDVCVAKTEEQQECLGKVLFSHLPGERFSRSWVIEQPAIPLTSEWVLCRKTLKGVTSFDSLRQCERPFDTGNSGRVTRESRKQDGCLYLTFVL